MKQYITLGVLCALLITLTACAPAIETDESEWVEQITLGSSSHTTTTSTVSTTIPVPSSTSSQSTTSATQNTDVSTSAQTSTSASLSTTTSTTTTTTTTAGTTANVSDADISVGYVNATTLRVRPEPNTTCEPIGGLKQGEQVTITGRSGDWYMIQFGETIAYVSAQYISATPIQ